MSPTASLRTASLAAFACLCILPASAEDPPDDAALRACLELVREAARAESVDSVALQHDLARTGDAAVPMLFAVLDTGIVPTGEIGGGAIQAPPSVIGAIWAAFAEMRPGAVRDYVARFASSEVPERTRATALRLLGGTGDANDFALFAALAFPDGAEDVPDTVRFAFTAGLAQLLERHPESIRWVRELFTAVHPALWPSVLTALTRMQTPDCPTAMAGLLGAVPAADMFVLREIGSLGRLGRGTRDEYVRGRVREYMGSPDSNLARAAIDAAGALCDEGALPELIVLMRSDDPLVRPVVRSALVKITGRDFGLDAARWEGWYAEELRFWRQEAHGWMSALSSDDASEVARAVMCLANRTLFRAELAAAIVPVLGRREATLRKLACAALGTLGLQAFQPELELAARDPDASVRAAAQAALSRCRASR